MPQPRRNPAEPGYYLRKLTKRVDDTVVAVDRATTDVTTPTPGGGAGVTPTQLIVHASDHPHIAEYYPAPPTGTRVLTIPISTQAQRDTAKPARVLVFPLVPR